MYWTPRSRTASAGVSSGSTPNLEHLRECGFEALEHDGAGDQDGGRESQHPYEARDVHGLRRRVRPATAGDGHAVDGGAIRLQQHRDGVVAQDGHADVAHLLVEQRSAAALGVERPEDGRDIEQQPQQMADDDADVPVEHGERRQEHRETEHQHQLDGGDDGHPQDHE